MENNEKEEDIQEDPDNPFILLKLKILLIGDSNVGKTSILLHYVDNVFPDEHIATIGLEYKEKTLIYRTFKIKLQVWDTAGEERFRAISKSIFRGTHGVIFVYDITNKESFSNVKNWRKEIENVEQNLQGEIIGNKIDLDDERKVNKNSLQELGEKYNMPYMEVSAKTGENIKAAFDKLVDKLFKDKTEDEIIEKYGIKNEENKKTLKKRGKLKKTNCC